MVASVIPAQMMAVRMLGKTILGGSAVPGLDFASPATLSKNTDQGQVPPLIFLRTVAPRSETNPS